MRRRVQINDRRFAMNAGHDATVIPMIRAHPHFIQNHSTPVWMRCLPRQQHRRGRSSIWVWARYTWCRWYIRDGLYHVARHSLRPGEPTLLPLPRSHSKLIARPRDQRGHGVAHHLLLSRGAHVWRLVGRRCWMAPRSKALVNDSIGILMACNGHVAHIDFVCDRINVHRDGPLEKDAAWTNLGESYRALRT
eukprot:scaffold576_cov260-Pinguiococcus_pyrenoidosus.AAC.109